MRPLGKSKTRAHARRRRHIRLRRKISGTASRPRLAVYRSLKHIYAQLVDDERGVTLVGVSDRSEGVSTAGSGKVVTALAVGKLLAVRARDMGIKRVVFDRGGYPYHGRVKAVAEGAREGGLEF
jgi:large subunit ribosomal protein L18